MIEEDIQSLQRFFDKEENREQAKEMGAKIRHTFGRRWFSKLDFAKKMPFIVTPEELDTKLTILKGFGFAKERKKRSVSLFRIINVD